MSHFKLGLAVALVALVSVPSIASAQNFTQRGTRNGAIAGAIIGGIIGDQRNNAFTGAVIGGVVGGAAGRAIGRSRDSQLYGNNQIYGNSFGHYQPHRSYYQGGGYGNYNGFNSVPTRNFYGGGHHGHSRVHHGGNNFGGYRNIGW